MASFRLSIQARLELDQIWDYAVDFAGIEYARRLNSQFFERFELLATQPLMGRARPELAPNVRSFPMSGYIILYFPIQGGVEIVHVVHGRRRLEYLFGLQSH